MNKTQMPELSRALIEIVWHFGPKGLDGQCCENLSLPEFLALDKVAGTKDCPVQEVGHALGFTKSGATRIVNRLEKKGYVEKVRSDEDARVCCVIVVHPVNEYPELKKENGHGNNPSCLTVIEQREGKSSHVHIHTLPCFRSEGYSL
ncbi:MarR family winged helix-turn-helix transcriptional regulator [Desulfoferrobacter suflitae]|uniref:MarR family winged helix-turn-helix transcriptional regulator n=1 Tax=Desulfoferrobacter suflitae TaxID=2865782 RepID=UPI002164351E|nr:helix-turn-helix domain-containing protein [Desulfoferrobacter suflitae]MCK8603738.1 MarR family transcriptional regulator [Desulfoferrobacter suflitae]